MVTACGVRELVVGNTSGRSSLLQDDLAVSSTAAPRTIELAQMRFEIVS
ncbi:hypothetical protein FTUN_7882 [Frigoriglobus tundricola]|uniref:Uncharacterized protein n=1 Tax=Frigoriglobus tundricola TaxID=2774151 RepID=A0A6M5Z3C8_9BACT|nr:hypothetical protein FTUN_7882 [Frigoriglobus tundricola]